MLNATRMLILNIIGSFCAGCKKFNAVKIKRKTVGSFGDYADEGRCDGFNYNKLASKSVNKSLGYEDKVTKSDDSTIE